ncbi:MAG TPA: XRE family transcriptional regulator [Rhizomicrobium sp.]|jgi:HTH-type transcriptional regulator/antitoxin HigA|nr:XRE family transcriptional regulator [Rhizomicrobium sp.]
MPVLNQRDYRSAKSRQAQIDAVLGPEAVVDGLTSSLSAEISSARRKALQAEGKKLRDAVEAYEKLQSSGHISKDLAKDELGLLPIIGRIARRLSQRELADLLDVSEQQIQRYETDRYATISLSRYKRVLDILGVELRSRLNPAWSITGSEPITQPNLEIDGSLISDIRKSNWVSLPKGITNESATQILATYVAASAELGQGRALHRRQKGRDAVINDSALAIWRARALRQATSQRSNFKTRFNLVDMSWITKLANLSARPDSPSRAVEFLRERGIILVIVPHLSHTRLDGAAMLLADGTPVIALTLRYDRLDSFWFTLFHEIGHILLHFNHGLDAGFVDDLDVTGDSKEEADADSFALSAFIPDDVWDKSPARFSNAPDLLRKFSESLKIHPAIVAGRIRKERGDYKIFNDLVGTGVVRAMFADQFA